MKRMMAVCVLVLTPLGACSSYETPHEKCVDKAHDEVGKYGLDEGQAEIMLGCNRTDPPGV